MLFACRSIARMKRTRPARRASAATGRAGLKKKTASKQTPSKSAALKRHAAKPKTASPKTIDEYFAAVPEPARSALHQIREAIRSVVPPEATEIISYKIPAFRHKKMLVWYATFSN